MAKNVKTYSEIEHYLFGGHGLGLNGQIAGDGQGRRGVGGRG